MNPRALRFGRGGEVGRGEAGEGTQDFVYNVETSSEGWSSSTWVLSTCLVLVLHETARVKSVCKAGGRVALNGCNSYM